MSNHYDCSANSLQHALDACSGRGEDPPSPAALILLQRLRKEGAKKVRGRCKGGAKTSKTTQMNPHASATNVTISSVDRPYASPSNIIPGSGSDSPRFQKTLWRSRTCRGGCGQGKKGQPQNARRAQKSQAKFLSPAHGTANCF